jgi:hypothetical protein
MTENSIFSDDVCHSFFTIIKNKLCFHVLKKNYQQKKIFKQQMNYYYLIQKIPSFDSKWHFNNLKTIEVQDNETFDTILNVHVTSSDQNCTYSMKHLLLQDAFIDVSYQFELEAWTIPNVPTDIISAHVFLMDEEEHWIELLPILIKQKKNEDTSPSLIRHEFKIPRKLFPDDEETTNVHIFIQLTAWSSFHRNNKADPIMGINVSSMKIYRPCCLTTTNPQNFKPSVCFVLLNESNSIKQLNLVESLFKSLNLFDLKTVPCSDFERNIQSILWEMIKEQQLQQHYSHILLWSDRDLDFVWGNLSGELTRAIDCGLNACSLFNQSPHNNDKSISRCLLKTNVHCDLLGSRNNDSNSIWKGSKQMFIHEYNQNNEKSQETIDHHQGMEFNSLYCQKEDTLLEATIFMRIRNDWDSYYDLQKLEHLTRNSLDEIINQTMQNWKLMIHYQNIKQKKILDFVVKSAIVQNNLYQSKIQLLLNQKQETTDVFMIEYEIGQDNWKPTKLNTLIKNI